ncbi:hypothetical protein C9374_008774 [Naegleria lovaniensis]|uniref:pyridoxal 5'-phosphate synthase n=1 Tax=Naegleria lovaniensis TaxID=51637 RepID=A0AA88GIU4_NAELO|nr:uncharacterized protein C9374_008774 [Naegleria lovaniensis]KAG2378152.1 hypothetical protein C9374_008774 [Naegleria lovaniensis]
MSQTGSSNFSQPCNPMLIFSEWYSQAQHTHQQLLHLLQEQFTSVSKTQHSSHTNSSLKESFISLPSILQLPPEPATMIVATVNPQTMQPSTRNVFLKSFNIERGEFVFCTNFQSRKANEMLQNDGKIALNFYWNYHHYNNNKNGNSNSQTNHSEREDDDAVEISSSPHFSDRVSVALNGRSRQVRIEGIGSLCSDEESDEYFNSRPLESRIASSVSQQSKIITGGRKQLLKEFENAQHELSSELRRPSHWGGIRVRAYSIEFWESGDHRLAHRVKYHRKGWPSTHTTNPTECSGNTLSSQESVTSKPFNACYSTNDHPVEATQQQDETLLQLEWELEPQILYP